MDVLRKGLKTRKKIGKKELEKEDGCGEGAEGEGVDGGPYEAGCDFNTWSSQFHYRSLV